MLTGQYAWRQRGTGILPGDAALIIPTRDKAATLGILMHQAGYRTAAIGKWHLGLGSGNIDWNKPISPAPADVGFDYSFIMAATGDRVPCVYVENGSVKNLAPQMPEKTSELRNLLQNITAGAVH
jgi:arylsulfatase A-like enzyme